MTVTVADTSTWVSAMQFHGTPFHTLVKALTKGDKDLLELGSFKGIHIITARQYLKGV